MCTEGKEIFYVQLGYATLQSVEGRERTPNNEYRVVTLRDEGVSLRGRGGRLREGTSSETYAVLKSVVDPSGSRVAGS